MALVLLKLIFFITSSLSNLITRLVFSATAHVLVQMIQALKVPGEGSQQVLEQVKNLIRACLEYLMGVIIKVVTSVFSSLFDLVKEGVVSSSSGLAGALTELVEKSKTSLEDVVQQVPEMLDAFLEMVGNITADLWNNGNNAVSYVAENVFK